MPCVFVININSHLTQTFRKSLCVFVLKYTLLFKRTPFEFLQTLFSRFFIIKMIEQ